MRLLVVEDEHSLREDIARKLRLSGYEVDACADGEAALEALTAERYDLVLLDLNLPKVDGMQVLRSLRQHDLETCVLILSARSEISDKVEGLDAGRTIIFPSHSTRILPESCGCPGTRWMPVQTARPRWRHWQQSGTTLYCWTSTCPRWTECRCCAPCAGTTLRPVC